MNLSYDGTISYRIIFYAYPERIKCKKCFMKLKFDYNALKIDLNTWQVKSLRAYDFLNF